MGNVVAFLFSDRLFYSYHLQGGVCIDTSRRINMLITVISLIGVKMRTCYVTTVCGLMFLNFLRQSMGDFRVSFCLSVKMSLRAKLFI